MSNATVPEPLPIGARAPAFDLATTQGGRVRLADFADAPVFVYVQSCNHCPYVHAYLERLKGLAHDFEPRGVRWVMVNSNDADRYEDDSFEAMKHFAAEHALPFPYAVDPDQSTARAYRTVRTPEVLVFDAERRLRYHGRIDDGGKDPSKVRSEDLREALEAILAGGEPAEPETWAVGCTVKWKPGNEPTA